MKTNLTEYLSRPALIVWLSLWIGGMGAAGDAALKSEGSLDPFRPRGSDTNRALSLHEPPRVQTLPQSVNATAYAGDNRPLEGYRSPARIPHTHYAIEVAPNASNRRLEGREEIRLENVPIPLNRLLIDWPYAASEELTIQVQNEPVRILSKDTNGLSASQLQIELPHAVEKGKAVSLKVQFGLPLRLGKITTLTDWHPRIDWGRNTVADYEVKVRAPAGYLVATSGTFDPSKDSYSASGCRVFGLVFMKDLKVLTAKSGDTEIHSYYDEASRKCVELTHQTAIEVIDFYRQWLGFYPGKILHIIPGGLEHPAGGYPVATAIVGIHGQAQMTKAPESHWRFITAHEIGHQYWMEHVLEAPNTFWLMIGLGVYADRAFMLAHGYGDKHERDMIGRYLQGVRDDLDTRMDRLPEDMEEVGFDYNNVVNHGKGFGVISALACTLGQDAFGTAYKRCLNEFKGRNLGVSDFRRVCEEESGETLDWFFDPWVRTSRFLSYEIASHETVSVDGQYVTTVKLSNLGTLSMPVPITATFEDGSGQRLFTDRLRDEAPLIFTSKDLVKDLVVDAAHELPLVVPPPEATVGQLKLEIKRLEKMGEGDKALRIYAKAKPATLEGLSARQLCVLGMSLFDGGYLKESLQAFQKCAASEKTTDPDYKLLGWVWQGHLLDLLNRRDEAVAAYQQALHYCDADTDIRHDQYGMRITKSWVEKRLRSPFQRPDPKIPVLRDRINDLQWTDEGDRALAIFNETKNISRADSGLPWGKLALCLYDGKHYPEALQAFKSDLAENPTAFSSLVWQGHLLDLMNQRAEAIVCYKQALEMNPTSYVRHDQYGMEIDRDWIQARINSPFQRPDSPAPR